MYIVNRIVKSKLKYIITHLNPIMIVLRLGSAFLNTDSQATATPCDTEIYLDTLYIYTKKSLQILVQEPPSCPLATVVELMDSIK